MILEEISNFPYLFTMRLIIKHGLWDLKKKHILKLNLYRQISSKMIIHVILDFSLHILCIFSMLSFQLCQTKFIYKMLNVILMHVNMDGDRVYYFPYRTFGGQIKSCIFTCFVTRRAIMLLLPGLCDKEGNNIIAWQ